LVEQAQQEKRSQSALGGVQRWRRENEKEGDLKKDCVEREMAERHYKREKLIRISLENEGL